MNRLRRKITKLVRSNAIIAIILAMIATFAFTSCATLMGNDIKTVKSYEVAKKILPVRVQGPLNPYNCFDNKKVWTLKFARLMTPNIAKCAYQAVDPKAEIQHVIMFVKFLQEPTVYQCAFTWKGNLWFLELLDEDSRPSNNENGTLKILEFGKDRLAKGMPPVNWKLIEHDFKVVFNFQRGKSA